MAWRRGGSTRAWRRLRRAVLDRDGWRCRMPGEDGQPCGRELRPRMVHGQVLETDPAHVATVEHLDRLADGHPLLAPMDRLVAACQLHNSQGGAELTNAIRRATRPAEPERSWTW